MSFGFESEFVLSQVEREAVFTDLLSEASLLDCLFHLDLRLGASGKLKALDYLLGRLLTLSEFNSFFGRFCSKYFYYLSCFMTPKAISMSLLLRRAQNSLMDYIFSKAYSRDAFDYFKGLAAKRILVEELRRSKLPVEESQLVRVGHDQLCEGVYSTIFKQTLRMFKEYNPKTCFIYLESPAYFELFLSSVLQLDKIKLNASLCDAKLEPDRLFEYYWQPKLSSLYFIDKLSRIFFAYLNSIEEPSFPFCRFISCSFEAIKNQSLIEQVPSPEHYLAPDLLNGGFAHLLTQHLLLKMRFKHIESVSEFRKTVCELIFDFESLKLNPQSSATGNSLLREDFGLSIIDFERNSYSTSDHLIKQFNNGRHS